jgi:hypothetical protein
MRNPVSLAGAADDLYLQLDGGLVRVAHDDLAGAAELAEHALAHRFGSTSTRRWLAK